MAEAIFKKIVMDDSGNQDKWLIGSAGTWAKPGLPASDYAQKVMLARGLSMDSHRSRVVDKNILADYALVLTMEPGHKEALQTEFPDMAEKIYLLSEMAGVSVPVVDPIGAAYREYELAADNIFQWLEKGKPKIYQLARQG